MGLCLYMWIKQTYQPYTSVGPTVTRPVQDPLVLAANLLNNRLYVLKSGQLAVPKNGPKFSEFLK